MRICAVCQTKYDNNIIFCPTDGSVLDILEESLVGVTLDNQYYIEAELGRGGMGAVYRARHILLGDYVAIKVLTSEKVNNPEALKRFLREAQTARRFYHPNVVRVYDMRTLPNGTTYMVLEYIQGHTLKTELTLHNRFSPAKALELLGPIGHALNAAHAIGVVHRDLKLENIMLGATSDNRPIIKLLDLGIAKVTDSKMTAMTQQGELLGTPAYMSPEQWGFNQKGEEAIDGRADIYSLAIAFYELIAGHTPFEGDSVQELASQHLFDTPPFLHKELPSVPEAFSRVIAQAMAKKRSQRPATCDEFIQQLQDALKDQPDISEDKTLSPPNTTLPLDPSIQLTRTLYKFEMINVDESGQVVNQRSGQAEAFLEEILPGVKLDMVWVPSGSFTMGSPDDEPKHSKDEDPLHTVTLTAFFMSKYPVTQAQWRAVAELPEVGRPLNPDPANFKGDDLPIENVSWDDCEEFCRRISLQTTRNYFLPSEAQWEYACRGGTTTPFYFGNTITTELANYNGLFRYGKGPRGVNRQTTTPVGSFGAANPFGLYDMHGNVWEWCADVWHDNYQDAPLDGSAWGSEETNVRRVMRGGSWYAQSNLCRSAARAATWSNSCNGFLGFRVVMAIASSGKPKANTTRMTLHWDK